MGIKYLVETSILLKLFFVNLFLKEATNLFQNVFFNFQLNHAFPIEVPSESTNKVCLYLINKKFHYFLFEFNNDLFIKFIKIRMKTKDFL